MMYHPVIQLQPATTAETHLALEEVKDFATTDMGRDGPQRWTYRILKEPELTQELARVAGATSKGRTDIVSFQPCSSFESRSQDRAIVEEWNIAGRRWTFTAVLDGENTSDVSSILTNWNQGMLTMLRLIMLPMHFMLQFTRVYSPRLQRPQTCIMMSYLDYSLIRLHLSTTP